MPVEIVAEAGINHNGDIQEAMRLVMAAKRSGADAVKFQLFNSHELWGDDRIAHLELSEKQMAMLKEHCDANQIEFLCTPFHPSGVGFLKELGVKRLKIASGCLKREPLLKSARESGLPLIVSTGMSQFEEVAEIVRYLHSCDLTILHCTSAYPCPFEEANLNCLIEYRHLLRKLKRDIRIGYSDHTPWIAASIAAVALGAEMIEKHLTLDAEQEGPDHSMSIEPWEFTDMVTGIRDVEKALGDGIKKIEPSAVKLRSAWHDMY